MLHRLPTRILALALLLCLLCASALAAAKKPKVTATPSPYPEATLAPDAPAYDAEKPDELNADQLYAWSAVLIEAESGKVIFEKSADDIRYPASTTKIMTVLLALHFVEDLDQTVTVSETADAVNNTDDDISSLDLQPGEEINFTDLLYGTMLASANDGANVIAETVSGSIERFVDLMNQYAQLLGCTNTHFANPHGLHDPMHYSTPRDMAIIAREAMHHELFRDIVRSSSYTIAKTNMHRARTVTNTNELYNQGTEEKPNKYYFPASIGIKTGFTSPAQYCFVGAALQDDVELISVVMYTGKRARWADTIKLMNYGFSQYESVTPVDLYNMRPTTIETSGYATDDPALGKLRLNAVPQNSAKASGVHIVATKEEISNMVTNLKNTMYFQYTRDFTAPITAGETIGTMTYFDANGEPIVYNLVASRSVARRANAPKTLEEIVAETYSDPNPFPKPTVEMGVYAALPFVGMYGLVKFLRARRKKKRRASRHTPRVTHRYLK